MDDHDALLIDAADDDTDPMSGEEEAGTRPPDPGAARRSIDDPDHPGRSVQRIASWVIVGIACVVVLASLNPIELIRDTTPTGGDMGAHVWGPRYLMDELLGDARVTGWTQDWYAGFPAYTFYMVVPSLMIAWLALGTPLWLAPFLLAGLAYGVRRHGHRVPDGWPRIVMWCAVVFLAVLVVPVPYNLAFKWVSVSGLVTLPLALFALGRAARLPFPGPPVLALAALPFIFDKGFTILGGNGASTMAGEFAFSISLTFAFLFLAVMFRGIRTGRDRALGAVLLALTILCHLIPAIFAGIATAVLLFTRREDRTPWWDRDLRGRVVAGVALLPVVVGAAGLFRDDLSRTWWPAVASIVALALFTSVQPRVAAYWLGPDNRRVALGAGLIALGAVLVALAAGLLEPAPWTWVLLAVAAVLVVTGGWDLRLVRWLVVVTPVGILLSGFWALPFLGNSTYLNDMGWEKYTRYTEHLLASPIEELSLPGMPYRNLFFVLAGLGVLLTLVHRVRLGYFLALTVLAFAWIFRYFPQYRLWNARLLPFYYLAIYLLAALAAALVIRSIAVAAQEWSRRRDEPVSVALAGAGVVTLVVVAGVAGALGWLPGGQITTDAEGRQVYSWGPADFERAIVADWARWNYSGLEDKAAYPEFTGIVSMMEGVADERGCGRAMWEYESDLQRFGTPMALMLLPYFTDGCVGSMEGLYFEASATTPFHFLNQSELSTAPSRAQRDLPYSAFDIEAGVSHLQLLGVKYYMATSDEAVEAARGEDRLDEVVAQTFSYTDDSGALVQNTWVVFEVADAEVVQALANSPVVATDADDHVDGWVYAAEEAEPLEGQTRAPKDPGPAVLWYNDPSRWDVPLATSGPQEWPRVTSTDPEIPRVAQDPVEVDGVDMGPSSLSFRVDEVGTPVLVRMSYFPNWDVEGAEGPFRVSPNSMVVIPTSEEVTLTYGRSGIEVIGWLATLLGALGLGALLVADDRRRQAGGDPIGDPSDAET